MRMTDPLARLSGYVLRRASTAAIAELNERLVPLELRHADVAMLMLIESSPGISQSHAGRVLDIQRANMVPFVARLEARGVMVRRQVDGRSQALALTGRGRALLGRVPQKLRPMVLPVLTALWGRDEA